MSTDVIKLNYPQMEDMHQAFQQGIKQLETIEAEMCSIVEAMENGALQGRGGTALVNVIQKKLCPAIKCLNEGFAVMDKDVKFAMKLYRDIQYPEHTT